MSKRKKQKSSLEIGLPDLHNQKMCLGKRVFWTEHAAKEKVAKILKKSGKELRAYHCPNCTQWHLTSTVQNKK